jgi:hypothetical protein
MKQTPIVPKLAAWKEGRPASAWADFGPTNAKDANCCSTQPIERSLLKAAVLLRSSETRDDVLDDLRGSEHRLRRLIRDGDLERFFDRKDKLDGI